MPGNLTTKKSSTTEQENVHGSHGIRNQTGTSPYP